MILSGLEITKQVKNKRIIIDPFDWQRINPNSYNFRLGDKIKIYREKILDPKKINRFKEMTIPENGLILRPETLYLGHIMERIGSNYYVPIIKGRSSIARLGLFIVITADLIDLGAIGKWTLQLHAIQPVKVYPGMLIGQMTFWKIHGKKKLYEGKYQGATGPGESQAWRDMRK